MRTGGEERRFWIARAPRFPATTAKCLREPFSKALGAPGSRAREDGRLKCRFRATLESGSPPLLTYIPLFAPLSCPLPPISPPFSLHFTVSSSSTASSSLRLLPCRPTRRRFSLSLSPSTLDLLRPRLYTFRVISRLRGWVRIRGVSVRSSLVFSSEGRRGREGEEKRGRVIAGQGFGDRWRWPLSSPPPLGPGGNSSSRSVFHLLYMQHIP